MHEENDIVMPALQRGDYQELERLSESIASFPEGEDDFVGRRWITNAIDIGSPQSVAWMLAKGVDLSFRDNGGYTPLHSALERRSERHQILEMLLRAGAPVNQKGINDWTPAHMAAARNDVESLKLLVQFGADLSIRTAIDHFATPLEEARHLGAQDALRYLESVV